MTTQKALKWLKAAGTRAAKTVAQTALAVIGTATLMGHPDGCGKLARGGRLRRPGRDPVPADQCGRPARAAGVTDPAEIGPHKKLGLLVLGSLGFCDSWTKEKVQTFADS